MGEYADPKTLDGKLFRIIGISTSQILLKSALDSRILKIDVNPDDGMGYGTDGNYYESPCLNWEWLKED